MPKRFRPTLSTLESRKLMAGNVSLVNGVVTIVGDANAPGAFYGTKNTLDVYYTDSSHSIVEFHLTENAVETTVDFRTGDVKSIDYTANASFNDIFNYTDIDEKAVGTTGFNEFFTWGNGKVDFTGSNDANIFIDYGHGPMTAKTGTGYNFVWHA